MNHDDVIKWSSDYFLNWSDFQADSNPSSFEDAHSTIKYRPIWTVDSTLKENQIQFFIESINLIVEFYPHLSWVRPTQASSNLLNHEQGHFDLAELYKPMIIQKMKMVFDKKLFPTRGQNQEQQKQFAREYSNILISNELKKWNDFLVVKQEEYDQQTGYGNLQENQQEYDEKFKKLRH